HARLECTETSPPEQTHVLTRRQARELAAQHAAIAGVHAPKRTGRSRVVSVVAGMAAFGLLGGTIFATGTSIAQAQQPVGSSAFALAADEGQTFAAPSDSVPVASVTYGSYAVDFALEADGKPNPKASLKSWTEYAEGQGITVPDGATRDDVVQLVADKEAKDAEEAAAITASTGDDDSSSSSSSDSSDDSSSSAAAPSYTGGGSPEEWMTAAGIAESDWGYVDYIVSRESGWNPNATNASSGACGLVQALPCSKVSGGGYDPVANLQWGSGYATSRYGSWAGAYAFWIANNWW
ncbi:MAG: transglycosylase SLT domain-containing protein, partial [Microbacterium sp.]